MARCKTTVSPVHLHCRHPSLDIRNKYLYFIIANEYKHEYKTIKTHNITLMYDLEPTIDNLYLYPTSEVRHQLKLKWDYIIALLLEPCSKLTSRTENIGSFAWISEEGMWPCEFPILISQDLLYEKRSRACCHDSCASCCHSADGAWGMWSGDQEKWLHPL